MADIKKLSPIIAKWEGNYVNDPKDRGGATNMGVTLATWQSVGYDKDNDGDIDSRDVKMLTKDDFNAVLRRYWNLWSADYITNQSIADILVDWVWGSGSWGIKIPQRILNIKQDGKVGPLTLKVLNTRISIDAEALFKEIYDARVKFLTDIVKKDPSQARFIKGWLNRLKDFKFKA